jgi:hypothetical protein
MLQALLGSVSFAKDRCHQARASTAVKHRQYPERLFVGCVRNEVFVVRDVESQGAFGEVRASVSDAW